jgi:dihydrofolate reductase
MAIIVHHAVSLDGYSADAGGLPAILEAPGFDHGASSHGIPEFMAGCDAVVMGRTTFEPAVTNPWWPWPNLDVLVLTSRPLPDKEFPTRVTAHASPNDVVDVLRRRGYAKNVEVLGGPSTIGALLDLGAVDQLRILVVPTLLGAGKRFAWGGRKTPLQLNRHTVYDGGTVAMNYTVAR